MMNYDPGLREVPRQLFSPWEVRGGGLRCRGGSPTATFLTEPQPFMYSWPVWRTLSEKGATGV